MRDTGGELTERGELLRLHQTVLRRPQIIEGSGKLSRADLDLVEQTDVFDGDHRLIREASHELDLAIGKWPDVLSRQDEYADGRAFAQQGNTQHGPVISQTLVFRRAVIWIRKDIGIVNGFAFERHT